MFLLETPRLVLVTTPLDVVRRRLENDQFSADVPVGAEMWHVQFPPEWPGHAMVLLPMMARNYNPDDWNSTLIHRADRTAIGQLGTKGPPDANGTVEIGYGLNPAYWGQGYASEAVGALLAFLLAQPTVRRITAETLIDNQASMRVLEKLGFARIGEREDEEDGSLVIWARVPPSAAP